MSNQEKEYKKAIPEAKATANKPLFFQHDGFIQQKYLGPKLGKHTPPSFKVGRDIDFYRMDAERQLFTSISDIAEEMETEINGDLADVDKDIPNMDFEGVTLTLIKTTNLALLSELYATSVLYGNEKTNTGLVDENGILPNGDGVGFITRGKHKFYRPVIVVSFSKLAKKIFYNTKPNRKEKTALWNVLKLMERKQFTDKTLKSDKLISITTSRIKRELHLQIEFHPIYAHESFTNYGELPMDIIDRINKSCKRKSAHTLDLLAYINIQSKEKEIRRFESDIMEEIGLGERYREHKSEAVKYLKNDLKVMVAIGMIYEPEVYKRPDGTLYVIRKNKDFCKTKEEILKAIEKAQKKQK